MPAAVLCLSTTVQCNHGAPGVAVGSFPRVTLGGSPVLVAQTTHAVPGCPSTSPPGAPPCGMLRWSVAATRVTAGGAPVLLRTSLPASAVNQLPGTIVAAQPRVVAT
jgi:hypothetical protein